MFVRRKLSISAIQLLFFVLLIIPLSSNQVNADAHLQSQPWIRVAVITGINSVTVSATGPSRLNEVGSSGSLEEFDSSHTYVFERSGSGVRLSGRSGDVTDGFSILCADDSGRLQLNGKTYRSMIRVIPWDDSLCVVNVLPIEEYIWGVVPCEVPPSWHVEALRAQAVAARTYSLRSLDQYPDRPFDVYSTVTDQVYNGCSWERESTTAACNDTFGEICSFDGVPIIAYFHAVSGGWTASGEEMFGRDLPYLRSVMSRDSAVHRWNYRISGSALANALRNRGHHTGTIQRVWVHRFSEEGRAEEIKIVHSDGVLLVSGADIRRALGPGNIQSTYFTVEGQSSPEIPDSSSQSPDDSVDPENPFEKYSSVHPEVLVPLPRPVKIEDCFVLAAGSTLNTEEITVIGSSESRRYFGGYVWLAEPVRVGDLQIAGLVLTNPQTFDTDENSDSNPVIDDPGANVGMPVGGSFIFAGTGMGHGVGMSQHGARIMAESGYGYSRILKYFYTGIEIERFW